MNHDDNYGGDDERGWERPHRIDDEIDEISFGTDDDNGDEREWLR